MPVAPTRGHILDRNGVVLQMNAAGVQMLGASSAEQLIGHCVYPLIGESDRDAFRKINESVFQKEEINTAYTARFGAAALDHGTFDR